MSEHGPARLVLLWSVVAVLGLGACGGGAGNSNGAPSSNAAAVTSQDTADCTFTPSPLPQALSADEVDRVLAQAVDVAQQLGQRATVAVTDRVGNVLGVFQMHAQSGQADAGFEVVLRSGLLGSSEVQGLENRRVPAVLAAVAKALTGAYLSSSGNAFTTRTASYIIQDHFPVGIRNLPSGPLFGVQFSQLPCGDLVTQGDGPPGAGPRRSPLGLAGDPGGLPLYKNGRVVGGIGVVTRADAVYGLDLNPREPGADPEEVIAQSASAGFEPPACIRADRITAGGVTLRFSASDAGRVQPLQTRLAGLPGGVGTLVSVPGYKAATAVVAGQAYGQPGSGFRPEASDFGPRAAMVLVDDVNRNRFALRDSPDAAGLRAAEVSSLLRHGLDVAQTARAQIRRPLGSTAEVTLSVVDAQGRVLGVVRTPDAPVFGADVSLQKARSAVFFSHPQALMRLRQQAGLAPAQRSLYLDGPSPDGRHAAAFFDRFESSGLWAGGVAFTTRALGNVHRPYFPDGLMDRDRGPLSTPLNRWSPFNPGLQLDLVAAGVLGNIVALPAAQSCTAQPIGLDNGLQIFPGSVPIYRGNTLVGGIGISGDGVDQDDMIAFLALDRASRQAGAQFQQAPSAMRADRITGPQAQALRYVQCPQSPFVNSSEQEVCGGR